MAALGVILVISLAIYITAQRKGAEKSDRVQMETPSTPVTAPPELKNSIGMEFVLIPAGTFRMGSTHGYEDERPPH
jgi:formylglycine-generating enzyme required for sulfatase activity